MLKLNCQYFGHLIQIADLLETPWCWERLKAGGEGDNRGWRDGWTICAEMAGWHHLHKGHEFEQALGDGEGQGSLVCWSPWGQKESNTTDILNNKNQFIPVCISQLSCLSCGKNHAPRLPSLSLSPSALTGLDCISAGAWPRSTDSLAWCVIQPQGPSSGWAGRQTQAGPSDAGSYKGWGHKCEAKVLEQWN